MKKNEMELKQVKVSVIVPVYNSEKYLRQCMDSICAQTLTEIEIICVDDGSTDASCSILEEYQQQDNRIQLYHESNRTAGAARNAGKAHASGEYMIFWDSDDYFDLHALEYLYEKASAYRADICVCGAGKYFEDWELSVPQLQYYMNKKKIPQQEVFNIQSNQDNILLFTTAAPWNKLFRRAFIEEKQLDFQEVRNGNDIYFIVCALCMAESIVTIEKSLITYRVHLQENLTGSTAKAPLTSLKAWEAAAQTLKQCGRFPERSFANRALKGIIYTLRNIREYDSFEQAVDYLKNSTLEQLHLTGREDGFYETAWHNDFIACLNNQTPEEIMSFLAYVTYMDQMKAVSKKQLTDRNIKKKNRIIKQNKEKAEEMTGRIQQLEEQLKHCESETQQVKEELKATREKNKKLQIDLKKIRGSVSYRIGRILTWMPRRIKNAVSKTDSQEE